MPAPKGNKFAKGNSGRPKKFSSAEEMQEAIDQYFAACDSKTCQVYVKSLQEIVEMKSPAPYSIEGLCETLEIDMVTLLNYEKRKGYEEFFSTVKKAKLKVQRNLVDRALEGKNNSAVSIFVMKNNFGYKDRQEVDHTTGGEKVEFKGFNFLPYTPEADKLKKSRSDE